MSLNQIDLALDDEASVVQAVRKAQQFLQSNGAPKTKGFLVSTAISELARNSIVHAGGGRLSLRWVEDGHDRRGIEVVVKDNGPGIDNVDLAFQDGYSTKNSLGLGLPGVKRIMDNIKVVTSSEGGCMIVAHKWF